MSETDNPRPGASMAELCAIMERLLAPDGCPWDREQTLESLRPYLLEEAYEVLDAMEQDHVQDHCEELGDLLLQVVFQSALRERDSQFGIDDVIASISDKLIRRHPHVFADSQASTPAEVHAQWDRIKAEEKRAKKGPAEARTLSGIPRSLPALLRAQKLGMRASRVGFDWPDTAGVWAKLREEIGELETAAAQESRERVAAELGDLLFAAVNLARKLDIDAEGALRAANQRFAERFEYVEDRLAADGRSPREADLEEMDALWNEAKRR
jgi:MazG family protein